MNRLKVSALALVAVGLWGAHLSMTSAPLAARAVEQASASLVAAPYAVAQRVEQTRSDVQAAVLKLSSDAALHVKSVQKPDAPTAERFNAIRTVALGAVQPALKDALTVVVVNEAGALMASGETEAAAPNEGVDVPAIVASASAGALVDVLGVPYFFFSTPMVMSSGIEIKHQGSVAVGAPLWGGLPGAEGLAGAVNKDLNLVGIGLWMYGKPIGISGSRDSVQKGEKSSSVGQISVIERGTASSLGPISLPMFVGTSDALEVALKKDVAGMPLEIVAVGSVRPAMEALASAQKTAFLMLFGLLLVGIAMAVITKDSAQLPAAGTAVRKEPSFAAPADSTVNTTAELPPVSPASANDFNFPHASQVAPAQSDSVQTAPNASHDPFAMIAAPPSGGISSEKPPVPDEPDDDRTTAYPAHKIPSMAAPDEEKAASSLDPFAAGPPLGSAPGDVPGEFNADATRVAEIPKELLKAAQRGDVTTEPSAAHQPPPPAPPPKAAVASAAPVDEEQHFQSTFRDFVSTRAKCGEPNDGMTFDRFAAKLRKNKEQLVAKYHCKTVRFQVYVKDGKAALKATPVKE